MVFLPLIIFPDFRYLWRGKHTFAIAQHKHHCSIYEEADSNKRRKRYARPLIDLHMKIYRYEGMEAWNPLKSNPSGKINSHFSLFIYCDQLLLLSSCHFGKVKPPVFPLIRRDLFFILLLVFSPIDFH